MDLIPLITNISVMGCYYLYAFKTLHYKPLNFKGRIHLYVKSVESMILYALSPTELAGNSHGNDTLGSCP